MEPATASLEYRDIAEWKLKRRLRAGVFVWWTAAAGRDGFDKLR